MSEIDIRNKSVEEVDVIRFADEYAQVVTKVQSGVVIGDGLYCAGFIKDKEHAENLITALQEAISRGWLV